MEEQVGVKPVWEKESSQELKVTHYRANLYEDSKKGAWWKKSPFKLVLTTLGVEDERSESRDLGEFLSADTKLHIVEYWDAGQFDGIQFDIPAYAFFLDGGFMFGEISTKRGTMNSYNDVTSFREGFREYLQRATGSKATLDSVIDLIRNSDLPEQCKDSVENLFY